MLVLMEIFGHAAAILLVMLLPTTSNSMLRALVHCLMVIAILLFPYGEILRSECGYVENFL